jgi:glycosyltransferase involved in cell wall biosynthesis
MNICFLDKTSFTYNSKDINSFKLRGAETILINLAISLTSLGHQVTVINNCQHNEKINNISWININHLNKKIYYDLAISNNDCQLFDIIDSKKKILISHSIQNIEKFIRKNQFFSYFKHRPKTALLGNYHLSRRNYITRVFGHFFLSYGVDEIFINTKINHTNNINKNLAIFTSRPDRNLNLLINIWKKKIYPNFKNGKLLITPLNNHSNMDSNIYERCTGDRKIMINDLISSRMLLLPGHEAELFCLAAEEARELCVPIITLGIGALSERVIHGKTGFIAKNSDEFSDYAINVFNDDKLWNYLRSNLLKIRGQKTWNKAAQSLLKNL